MNFTQMNPVRLAGISATSESELLTWTSNGKLESAGKMPAVRDSLEACPSACRPNSRKFTNTAVLALSTMLGFLGASQQARAEWKNLWEHGAPGGANPPVVHESTGKGERLTDTSIPQYEVFLPDAAKQTGAAVVIFPGGGYTILAMEHEGRAYAHWLRDRGIVAVIAKYRVSGQDAAQFFFPVPLLDARRAIRTTRAHAAEWKVNPAKIGVMGSSAGGHLASMCATLWNDPVDGEGNDEIDRLSCRPDFAVLIYPVITIADAWTHAGSKRRLLGEHPAPGLAEYLSTNRRVNAQTPPCFLVHASDDAAVPMRNSLEFAARCAENKVPVVLHGFAIGGHGFGLNGSGDSIAWPSLLESWLAERAAIGKP